MTVIELTTRNSRYTASHAAALRRNINEARALVRVMNLAADAIVDGGFAGEDPRTAGQFSGAWVPISTRMHAVRDVLMETIDAPGLDWVPPVQLSDALDAALWGTSQAQIGADGLTYGELVTATDVLLGQLDALHEAAAADESDRLNACAAH